MKKKIVMFCLSICLFAASCAGNSSRENTKEQSEGQGQNQSSQETNKDTKQEEETSGKEEKEASKEEQQDTSQKEEKDTSSQDEQLLQEEDPAQALGQELSKTPEVAFVDYSQKIQEEGSDVLLLNVTENCPVISIPENQDAAEKMNMVFEQQHTANETYIQEDTQAAREAYQALSKEEAATWGGYGYGLSYKVVYASPKILSIEAETYKWQGNAHPNTWTSSYCFDAATGTLLYLSDIFTDKVKAGKIVEEAILDTITKEPYKDALMPDYESYVPDVLTENVFYLNEKGLVVICNPDMVTVYAAGVIEVEVPYEALKSVMNPNFIVE